MEAFYTAAAITFGILMPIIVVLVMTAVVITGRSIPHALEIKLEEIKRQPPFEEVDVNVSPSTNVMTVRFTKNGVVIWQGSSSRREMAENGKLVFTTEVSNE